MKAPTAPSAVDIASPAGLSDPARAGVILATLVIVAAVANLPLAMANVALPAIGAAFDASQTQLNLVAVAYSLGLACSVLWLGALGDRYGRKQIAILGVSLAIPAALICAFAPVIEALIAGRLLGGGGCLHRRLPAGDADRLDDTGILRTRRAGNWPVFGAGLWRGSGDGAGANGLTRPEWPGISAQGKKGALAR